MKAQVKAFVARQQELSSRLDSLLPDRLRVDGMTDYLEVLLPGVLSSAQVVYDVGGGKHPYIDARQKRRLDLRIVGIDISAHELDASPEGVYDEAVVADISQYRGRADGDVVIASAVLEHVRDIEGAFDALVSILAPGGCAVVFVPSRNALFARLNILLPERITRLGLELIRGHRHAGEGFPAFYRRCTPRDFADMAAARDLTIEEERLYYVSGYFFAFVPAYVLWRAWILLYRRIDARQSAESFAMIIRKPLGTGSRHD